MENKTTTPRPKSLAKGLLAGLIGGLAGVAAMAAAEHLLPHRAPAGPGSPDPSPLDPMHWSFGLAVGAAYGAVAEYFPAATAKEGAALGMALESLADHGTLPALGLFTGSAPRVGLADLTSRIVYGVATEAVRGFVRRRL